MSKRYYCFLSLCLLLTLTACAAPPAQVVIMPTLAVLPSATPAPTETLTPTALPTDTPPPTAMATETPNLVETQVVQLQATNVVAQSTLDALLTRMAPTATPAFTLTPSLTITSTLLPSALPPQVVPMQPRLIYAQSTANLRTCPRRECDVIAQLQTGEAVMATGTIQGEALMSGNPHWFRVDHEGRELYIYSQLVNVISPPTAIPPTAYVPPPTSVPIFIEAPPISVPQTSGGGGGSCPSLSATCGSLTCDQAYACLAAGNGSLDRDKDGVPCESVCNP